MSDKSVPQMPAITADEMGGSERLYVAAGSDDKSVTADQLAKFVVENIPVDSQTEARSGLGLGNAATLNVPASGAAASGELVKGNDPRLSDARTPTTHTHPVNQITGLGTAATLNVPASGNAGSGEVVKGDDGRLSDSRTPTTHTHTASQISDASTLGRQIMAGANSRVIRGLLNVDEANAPKLVGSFPNTFLLSSLSSISRATFRTQHVCLNRANEIRVAWYGGNVSATPPSSEAGFGNPVEVKASIEVQGVLIPLFFNGRRRTLLRPGQLLVSDPCGVFITAGETFFVRLFMTRLKSDTYGSVSEPGMLTADQTNCYYNFFTPNSFSDASGSVYDNSTGVDPYAFDYTDSGTVPTGFAYGLRPYAITGRRCGSTIVPGIAIIGDSISRNTGDNSRYATGQLVTKFDGFGWVQRGLGDNYPVVQNAIASEGLYHMVGANTKNFNMRFLTTRWADFALLALGNNDMAQSVGTIQSNFSELVLRLTDAGLRVIACTVLPRTTSTDFWKTTANQTVSANKATNDAINAWIRAGVANVYAVLDINPAVENGSGKWLAPEAAQITGTTTAGSTTTVINVGTTLSVDTLAGKMLVIGSEGRYITDNSTSSITVQSPFTSAPGSGVSFEVIDSYTPDGIHPNVRGHVALGNLLAAAAPTLFV